MAGKAKNKKNKNKHRKHRGYFSPVFHDYRRDLAKLAQLKTPVLFSELSDELKKETLERLRDMTGDFFAYTDYLPEDEDRDEILKQLCDEISETLNQWEPEPYDPNANHDPRFDFGPEYSFDEKIAMMKEILQADAEDFDPYAEPEEPEPIPKKELIVDNDLKAAFDNFAAEIKGLLKADGIELPTYIETLTVAETERLIIRRFYKKDLLPLWEIMKKPEVMYSWESGFKKSEARKWLSRQYTRYHKDSYGYFAVTLKESGKLIGQTGIIKENYNGEAAAELGCIFDVSAWGQGYAMEAACACVNLAFRQYALDRLCAAIRPENAAGIKLAEKLGMKKSGEIIKTYKDMEIPHDIYLIENLITGVQK